MSDAAPPPTIPPAPPGGPRWSVMIPSYNCATYLRRTLESVLEQATPDMQIEVVDDCSTRDDPEAVTRETGGGRVQFYRKPANGGAVANFNTCVGRSRGELVHILHGDDYVCPGFYRRAGAAFDANPDAGMVATRAFVVDERGEIEALSDRVTTEPGVTRHIPAQRRRNGIVTPGVVLRRAVYEEHGGFLPSLIHTADWEMWDRAAHAAGCLFINEPLACYRSFAGNDTGRLARTGENLRDYLRLEEVFARRHPDFSRAKFEEHVEEVAWAQYERFERLGDTAAAAANHKLWRGLHRKRLTGGQLAAFEFRQRLKQLLGQLLGRQP